MPADTAMLPPLLLLHPEDNVFVARRTLRADELVAIDGHQLRVPNVIPLGHKIARYALPPGTRIVKYGAAIGSATQAIHTGEHVHMHNMKSDYLPSHTRESSRREP
jgi:(2R)-sulfolactate sulfo-lyase subunit alpha